MTAQPRYVPIHDYALIGDSRSVALVSRAGSIDWWCLPRFDSDPVFARVLDAERGGFFEVTPAIEFTAARAYQKNTNILITRFRTHAGEVRVTDFMPALTEEQKRTYPIPFRCIVRRIEGISGHVPVRVALRVRPHYGQHATRPRRLRGDRIGIEWQGQALFLTTSAQLNPGADSIEGQLQVSAGERIDLVLGFSQEAPADMPFVAQLDHLQEFTAQYWQHWVAGCSYRGPAQDAVERSLLTLKLLSYAPSGAIIAAPTTSLPEHIGGKRNWDYRYCWLRDAGFTVRALLRVGTPQEAHAFAEWLLYATRLTYPELQVMYTVFGESKIPERTIDALEGYRGSRPVRVGNAAACQFQLDIYGEVADALAQYHRSGGRFDRDAHKMILGIAKVIAQRWRDPDYGIWEARSGVQQNTHSKIMAWVGLERCLELSSCHDRLRSLQQYAPVREEIFNWIIEHGYDAARGCFTATPHHNLDAALLVMPLVGFLPAHDARVIATVEAIQRSLAEGELVYRYHGLDGMPPGEGAFLMCSFWLVEALARMGRVEEAQCNFEKLLKRCNDVGLLAEQIDPATGEQLGNFPQALSHIGLINAALTLAEEDQGSRIADRGMGIADRGSRIRDRSSDAR